MPSGGLVIVVVMLVNIALVSHSLTFRLKTVALNSIAALWPRTCQDQPNTDDVPTKTDRCETIDRSFKNFLQMNKSKL